MGLLIQNPNDLQFAKSRKQNSLSLTEVSLLTVLLVFALYASAKSLLDPQLLALFVAGSMITFAILQRDFHKQVARLVNVAKLPVKMESPANLDIATIVGVIISFSVLIPAVVLHSPALYAIAAVGLISSLVMGRSGRELSEVDMMIRSLNPIDDRKLVNSQLDTPNVLVIGGAGYIGSGLLKKLLAKGYRVRLLDAFMFGEEPIADLMNHQNLEVYKADFRQMDQVVKAMTGMDAVVHIGAIVGDPACALDEQYTVEVNLVATRLIAECAKGMGIKKFIFASTCSVYGASDEILDEESDLNPVSLYARSKIACEKVLHGMTDASFQPTIIRFGTVYGLSGRTRFDLVINQLTAKAMVEGKITVFGEDQWRPFVHVDDASLAVATVLHAPIEKIGGQTFNVGSEAGNMTLGQVGRLIEQLVPTAEYIASGVDGDRRNYRVDFSKIKNELGFEPAWNVEQGIRQVIEAFNSGKVTDHNDMMYSNVKFLATEAKAHGLETDLGRLMKLVQETAA